MVLAAVGLSATACSESYAEVEIKLPTVQCDACVLTVTKALEKVDGVSEANVDLNGKVVRTSVVKLEQVIVKAGYAANDKKANAESYAGLPACCKVQ
jgi:copper chaperone CopZ